MTLARTSKRTLAAHAAAVLLASVTALPTPARAQAQPRGEESSAEELFQRARGLVDAGKYADACPLLERSQKLDPAVGTQFNLADCYEHVGRTASAYALYNQVASIAHTTGKVERERSAKERAKAIEPKLARVQLAVASPAPGLEIKIDDVMIDKAQWTVPFPIDPGDHQVHVTAPNRRPWAARLTAEEAKISKLDVPELVDPTPKVIAPPPAQPSSTQRTIALVTGGAGLVAVGIGTVAGIIAISKRSMAERECPKATYDFRCPTEDGSDAWNSSTSAGDISTVGFIAGGVLLTGAAVLWFTAPSSRARAGASLSGIRIEGSF